ncbi:MAG TPA: M1 family metallopeptidase [Cytophagaceae bacterium]|jgi:aminopeptidase N|nr:M1 family metallopeptidase [Cytophagaceae bacterium]
MKRLFILLFFFPSILTFSQQKITSEDSLRGILSPERKCFDVYYYDLSITVNTAKQYITGSNSIYFTAEEDFTLFQLDLDKEMQIGKITDKNDSIITYSRKGNSVFVRFPEMQKRGIHSFIKIYYEGQPHKAINAPWDGGFVWASDSLNRPWVAVACEGVGASLWWPCKDHPSDEPDSMRMRFEVPAPLFCASNGNLTSTTLTKQNTKIYEWKVNYPINIYNVTLNIGYYSHISDTYKRTDSTTLALDYYVLSYNKEKAERHFKQVKKMLECYEVFFGKYPFEKDGYALIEAPYWGMEHQSAVAYGNRFKNNMLGFDYIIVHESGHEWWGNNISSADHADLWIHEAFTTYGEALLVEYFYNKEEAEKYLAGQKRMIKNREIIIGPYGVNYHYWKDSDMYYKGALMLHTLRNSLNNDSLWFSLLRGIQTKFAGKQISSSELIGYINTYTHFDYTSFFDQYLLHKDLPVLEYQIVKKDKKNLHLKYRWKADEKAFSLPLIITANETQKIRIYPSADFKTLVIPIEKGRKEIDFNINSFYIEIDSIKK